MIEDEAFDFGKYRVNEEIINPQQIAIKENTSEEPFSFDKYKVKEPRTKLQEFGRHVARTGSRAAEAILGFPGDIVGFTKYLGESLPEIPNSFKKEPNFIQRAGRKVLESVPNSEDLKKFSSYITDGFTDPQGAAEELGDEVSSLATVLINPSKAVQSFPKFLKTLGTSFAKAGAVKGAGEGAKKLGATEGQQNAVELGTLFLTGLLGKKTADKFISQKYEKARSKIPKGTVLDTTDLYFSLENVEKELAKGLSTPTKDKVKESLKELKGKSSTGLMEADELVQSVHDINEIMNSKKLFDELNTSERKLLKFRYDLVKDEAHKEISKYGKTNPEFYKEWTEANNGYGAIASSKKVGNWLQSKVGTLPKHLAGSLALDVFLGHPAAIPTTLGGYGLLKTGEFLTRIVKDPKLTNHYMKVILEGTNENLPGVIKHLDALDKEAKKINSLRDQQSK